MTPDLSKVKGIIFDMDGVLFSSGDCHEEAFRQTFESAGIKNFSYKEIAGMRTDEAIKKVFVDCGRTLRESEIEALVVSKQKKVRELLAEKGSIMEGCVSVINALQGKYRLLLASSASRGTIDIFFRKSGLKSSFEVSLDGASVERAKPEPDIYLLALRKLHLEPDQCVVIEDSINGMRAAMVACIPVIAFVGSGECSVLSLLSPFRPVAVISKLADIQQYL